MTDQPPLSPELDEIERRPSGIENRMRWYAANVERRGVSKPGHLRILASDCAEAAEAIAERDKAADTIRQLREQVSYLAGEPSPPATMNDYRSPELDAAVLALRNAGQDEAAQIIGRFRLEFRAAKDREITAQALLCELRGHFHDDGRTQIIKRELIEKIDAFAPAQSTAS